MLHCNMILRWQRSHALQFLQPGRVVNLERGGRGGERLQGADEIARGRHGKMGQQRGAAELHPPEQSPDSQPEIAFSVEASVRRRGVGSILFARLISEAHAKGYASLRITTGAENGAMRALASKFGAHLTFRHGESSGSIDLKPKIRPEPAKFPIEIWIEAMRAVASFNRAYWRLLTYAWGRSARSSADTR